MTKNTKKNKDNKNLSEGDSHGDEEQVEKNSHVL